MPSDPTTLPPTPSLSPSAQFGCLGKAPIVMTAPPLPRKPVFGRLLRGSCPGGASPAQTHMTSCTIRPRNTCRRVCGLVLATARGLPPPKAWTSSQMERSVRETAPIDGGLRRNGVIAHCCCCVALQSRLETRPTTSHTHWGETTKTPGKGVYCAVILGQRIA